MSRHAATRRPLAPALLLVGAGAVVVGAVLATAPPTVRAADLPPVDAPRTAAAVTAPQDPGGSRAGAVGDVAVDLPAVAVMLPGVEDAVPVVPVGVLASGALQLPPDPAQVGWWAGGAAPGATEGTVVLAGHLDERDLGAGPLTAVVHAQRGDEIVVADASGGLHRYAVSSRTTYPKSELPPDLFTRAGEPRLVLVTCGGAFDASTGHYEDNVVLVARPA